MSIEASFDRYGYPTDSTLDAIEHWDYRDLEGLIAFAESAWRHDMGWWRREANLLTLATGGWSGNESVVSALHNNGMFWALCWMSSERGGCFTFEIPAITHDPLHISGPH